MFQYVVPSRIVFGNGSSEKAADIAVQLNARKVFCVYDQGVKSAGISDVIIGHLKNKGIDVVEFGDVLPNPPDTSVYIAAELARENDVDAIVAVGGGSSIDTAKGVNILLANPGPVDKYEGPDKVLRHARPLIAIPTTAGTSSEVTHVTVLTNTKETRKMVILGRNVGADYALVDPELTIGLPPSITAATGMDALTHAIESYLSVNSSPLTEFNSLKAAEIISQNLETAVSDGKNITARTNMMLGCVIAGFAFNNADLGMVHAIAHTLSAHFGLAHGVANAAVLPYVMEFNAAVSAHKLKDMARAMGVDVARLSDQEGAAAAVRKVLTLSKKIGIPTLKDAGVTLDRFDRLAEDTLKEGALMFNPLQPGKEDVLRILNKAY